MSFNKTKTDPVLGAKIQEHLLAKGVATPVVDEFLTVEAKEKISVLEKHFFEIWKNLGMDMTDDSLCETPKRMAKMYVLETMWGLLPENFPKCTAVDNKMSYDEMVLECNINVQSNCEHHGVVIDGLGYVAYMPKDKVLGLSKINRIVEYFAKRPQIQERLTEQVYYALQYILGTDDIAVVIDATHYCVKSRGVEDTGSSTMTSKLGGQFKENQALRQEFMSLVNAKRIK
tara:strand:- start:133931 stop:134620 length:690 start_codon:yes stop_codon:yes gene_type:complete